MRRFGFFLLFLCLSCVFPGCGGASGIEPGIPENLTVPKDFDPGGGAVPDMKGTSTKPKR
jgi:hypothetical protein